MKIRLILTTDCNRACEGCCNKQFDLEGLPTVTEQQIRNAEMVMLTGGEPRLVPKALLKCLMWVRRNTNAPVYLYTACMDDIDLLMTHLALFDGMTLTLHDQYDFVLFGSVLPSLQKMFASGEKSLRLNVFKEAGFVGPIDGWLVRDGLSWIDPCPLPEGEILVRWNGQILNNIESKMPS